MIASRADAQRIWPGDCRDCGHPRRSHDDAGRCPHPYATRYSPRAAWVERALRGTLPAKVLS
jgi:predicted Zn-ribbon and HTH transcriptional regulator